VGEPLVLLTDQVADGALSIAESSINAKVGLAWMPSLCSIDTQAHIVAFAQIPVGIDQHPWAPGKREMPADAFRAHQGYVASTSGDERCPS